MICPNCGRELNDDAVFCISCGKRLSGTSEEGARPVQKAKNKAPLIIGLGVLAIILIIGIAVILLLDPFSAGNEAKEPDLAPYVDETPETAVIQETQQREETQMPEETAPAAEEPAETQEIVQPERSGVGVPVPAVSADILQTVAEQYWKTLSENESAEAYGLLNLTGDEVRELIVQERQTDGTSGYSLYYFNGDNVVKIPCDRIAAGGNEKLLCNDGRMIVLYSSGYASMISVDPQLKANAMLVAAPEDVKYTSSSVLVPADDRSLLDLHLLGKTEDFSYTGWIRHNSVDYYYRSGKPLTRAWVEEEEMLYYLGDGAYVTETASQEILSDLMNAYFESYQKAFNEKDVSYLKYSTEANKAAVEKKLHADENKFLTIAELTCRTTVHKLEDETGNISLDVYLEYIGSGEWADAKEKQVQKSYRVVLVWTEGQWCVDHMGNR